MNLLMAALYVPCHLIWAEKEHKYETRVQHNHVFDILNFARNLYQQLHRRDERDERE